MQTALLVVHLMVAASLVTLVLFQQSEGGALGMGGGGGAGGGFMSGRGTANLLTRVTAFLAVSFFATSIGLTILANRAAAPPSLLEDLGAPVKSGAQVPGAPANAPAKSSKGEPSGGGIFDALKQGKGGDALPSVPQGQ